jgi:hypothetical protein
LSEPGRDDAHRAIEECQLFLEGAFSCYNRISDAEAEASAKAS